MNYYDRNNESGFTLIELLITMTIGLIILTALSSTFLMQSKIYDVQEQVAEMVQNARAAMDMMSREIRMAGYDPTGSAGAGIVSVATDKIYITMDITGGESDGIDNDGDGNVDEADEDKFVDGVLDDSNEHIVYDIYDNKLGRTVGSSANVNNPSVPPYHQPVAENIEDLQISQLGNSINVSFNVSLIARTSKPDPDYTDPTYGDHYRRYTLTSVITPRNLNL